MQTATQQRPISAPQTQVVTRPWAITYEMVIYALLIFGALAFRLADLDRVPMSPTETAPALAAWRVVTGSDLPWAASFSPAVFWAQVGGFTLLGSTELAARVLTAIVGAALAFAPLLFRDRLGAGRTLALCALLTISPSLMLAARFSAPVIWSLLLAVGAAWAWSRFWQTGERAYGGAACAALTLLALASEPGGIPLLLILLGAGAVATLITAADTDNDDDAPTVLARIRARLSEVPALTGVGLGFALTVIVATGFMLFPAGLGMVGEALGELLAGAGRGGLAPLGAVLYYEPLLLIFAVAGAFIAVRRDGLGWLDWFFLAWLSLALLMSLLFGLPNPAQYALWFVVPLAGLATHALTAAFAETRGGLWTPLHDDDPEIRILYSLRWGRPILAVVWLGLFTMLAMHLQIVAREVLLVENGNLFDTITRVIQSTVPHIRGGGLWTLVTLLFMFVGFFLAASIWGQATAWQGVALGLLGFMIFNHLGAGWNGAVFGAGDPVEPWHNPASSEQVALLRQTLVELAAREAGGEPHVPITIVLNPDANITIDGAVAWAARDFVNARFVSDLRSARTSEIILMAQPDETPTFDANGVIRPDVDLGGSYVGDRYWLTRTWDAATLQGFDFLAWWFQRRARVNPLDQHPVLLWVRVDIYNRAPFNIASPQG